MTHLPSQPPRAAAAPEATAPAAPAAPSPPRPGDIVRSPLGFGRETVEFSLIGIAPISGTNSYQARWRETVRNAEGGVKADERWMATFNVEIHPPTSAEAVAQNPIGLYIKDFQWSREL